MCIKLDVNGRLKLITYRGHWEGRSKIIVIRWGRWMVFLETLDLWTAKTWCQLSQHFVWYDSTDDLILVLFSFYYITWKCWHSSACSSGLNKRVNEDRLWRFLCTLGTSIIYNTVMCMQHTFSIHWDSIILNYNTERNLEYFSLHQSCETPQCGFRPCRWNNTCQWMGQNFWQLVYHFITYF
jgi:hypothetical protein